MKKIVVIGPESSGKSTLCEDLSAHFKSTYLPEYARIYLENNGSKYTYEDVIKMAKGQLESELHFTLQNPESPLLLLDTNYLVYKVWIKEKYSKDESFIERLLKEDNYDYYFLADKNTNLKLNAESFKLIHTCALPKAKLKKAFISSRNISFLLKLS